MSGATAGATVGAGAGGRPGPMARLRRAVADGRVMTRRNMAHLVRAPEEMALYFTLPVMFVLVFGYVFGSGMRVPGGGSYREFLLPGVFAMTMLYGMGATGTAVAMDAGRGVVDRFRSMPVARSALLTGRSAADLLRALLEMAVLVVCGLLVGWEWHRGAGRALLAVALVLALRVAVTWIGIWLGLVVRNPDTVGTIVFPLAFPLTALSNVFTAPELMPGWLATVAEWNPLSATVAAIRELFGNPGVAGTGSWAAEHPLLLAVAWPVALTAVFAPLAVRRYQRLSA
ncbi:ABC transporter permease [Streptomyces sp. DSM 44917]|uniref:Transport permease protein n=1 Tax=Streptomyces boetiae TaxID=3075541 RepID=A0ABU2LDX8_9ACTN|nr:ABC transporter permease [Streptomyces sp. DSM 44917]MDT0309383.1 ABC transporter permease [Streptomyces sp. DSM 44917]